jgi:predicted membrane-bound mannosyltransferase/sugar lactone lactonase YvrE
MVLSLSLTKKEKKAIAMQAEIPSPTWLERPLFKETSGKKLETVLVILILILAILSRFTILGERVMSHDEVNHVWPSYDYFKGKGYTHNPITHGPFQFHIVALSYFVFGDSDFSSRIPAATFSTAAVAFVLFGFRRYLGRAGALIGGFLFLISPYLLFYGRYTRNEGFIEFYLVVMLYAVLRHLEKGDNFSLYLLTGTIVMHFATKETSFIYMAQLLIFLMLIFLKEVQRAQLNRPGKHTRFVVLIGLAMLLVFVAIGFGVVNAKPVAATPAAAGNIAPGPSATPATASGLSGGIRLAIELVAVLGALGLAGAAFFFLIKELGWPQLRRLRSFNLLILTGTLVLPQLAAFPIKMIGWDPLDYSSSVGLLRTGVVLGIFLAVSAVIGYLWNPRLWLKNAFLFYAVYVFLYTSMFTNGGGFFSGIIGSLGYWLNQQGEQRGGQPWYYFALLQIPIYEYLGLLGSFLALYFGLRFDRFSHLPGRNPADAHEETENSPVGSDESTGAAVSIPDNAENNAFNLEEFYARPQRLPVLALLLFWSVTALIAYSVAGEKMPWLTVHITMGMLLAAGWGLGFLVDTTEWKKVINRQGLIALALLPIFFTSTSVVVGTLLGAAPPFAGNTLDQLQATGRFVFSVLASLSSLGGLFYLLRGWEFRQVMRLATLTVFSLLALLTARTAYQASFINYDHANEFLVYAHMARGPKDILAQIEEISRRTAKGKSIAVAYSADAQYPYLWYMRDYTNVRWFGDKPTRELRDVPIILAGEDVFNKMDPVVADNYIMYEYMRIWWPMQDYWNLDWKRVSGALSNPAYRQALWEVWLNRDFTRYAAVSNSTTLTLENWQPSAKIRMYIRKDIVSQIWNYGAQPTVINQTTEDPYKANMIQLSPDLPPIGQTGANPGELQAPRGIAIAPDGSLFVADSRNQRIQHFAPDGKLINTWGSFADVSKGDAPGGTFNEPWDVAVGADGTVFVSDTWNHRIQAFKPDGTFLRMWGYFGQGDAADAFWGPRGLAIDAKGRVYVADTGNKRIAIFEPDGTSVAQFGTSGMETGQFDELTGLAIDKEGLVYVADTWNQRVQVFVGDETGKFFTPLRQFAISGWYGQSLDNKPYLKVSPLTGHILVADPEGPRILEFANDGTFIRGWGQQGELGMASGLAVDAQGGVWVSDGLNNQLLHFTLPE